MKNEPKPETSKTDTRKLPLPSTPTMPRPTRVDVPVGELLPDADNRVIDEDDEDFLTLLDSIRVMGVLEPVHAWRRPDGTFLIVDGERRWRAARRIGLATVPCEMWPEGTHPRDVILAGVVLNEQRQAHSCLPVARRLRAVKNQFAETHEQVAARTGLPIPRVKSYLSLFNASDLLLGFFDDTADVSLKTAVELVRYEKALGESSARRLIERHGKEPLTAREVEALRKRGEARARTIAGDKRNETEAAAASEKPGHLEVRIQAAFKRNATTARAELEKVVAKLGFQLVPLETSTSPQRF